MEEELECLRDAGFLAVMVRGLKMSTSILSLAGSATKKENILIIFNIETIVTISFFFKFYF